MAMSRKDYRAIAAHLHSVKPPKRQRARFAQWERTVSAVVSGIHSADNWNIDTARFYEACENGL